MKREVLMSKPNRKPQKTIDAIHHIGPTLESEEPQTYVPTREEQVSKEELAAESDLHIHRVETEGNETRIIEEGKPGTEPEPLRTHLAGDTSSHPPTHLTPETPKPLNKRRKNAA